MSRQDLGYYLLVGFIAIGLSVLSFVAWVWFIALCVEIAAKWGWL